MLRTLVLSILVNAFTTLGLYARRVFSPMLIFNGSLTVDSGVFGPVLLQQLPASEGNILVDPWPTATNTLQAVVVMD